MTLTAKQGDLYGDCHAWKGQMDLFTYSVDHAGYFRNELRHLKIAGAELSERSWQFARALGVDVLRTDLPAEAATHAGRFGTILAFDVFEHQPVEALSQYLAACETMLRLSGRLLLRFRNSQSPFGLFAQAGDPTYKAQLSRQAIELLAIDSRLEVLRYSGSHVYIGSPFSLRGIMRRVRQLIQAAIGAVLRFAYATAIPYVPVVVVVLERKA